VLHAEIAAAMRDELVDFLESAVIEQKADALPGSEFPGVVLAAQAIGASAAFSASLEVDEAIASGHEGTAGTGGAA
jgi:hypothetical protein